MPKQLNKHCSFREKNLYKDTEAVSYGQASLLVAEIMSTLWGWCCNDGRDVPDWRLKICFCEAICDFRAAIVSSISL